MEHKRSILICFNAFKDCATAFELCQLVAEKVMKSDQFHVVCCPMADGGDGSLRVIADWNKDETIEVHSVRVCNPVFDEVEAEFVIGKNGTCAVVEIAEASGIRLISEKQRNALFTSSFGTGQLIKYIVENFSSVTQIIVCLGGSATIDGGCGMAAALGFEFFDKNGLLIERPVGADMIRLGKIVAPSEFLSKKVSIIGITDVTTPLLGPNGCVPMFSLQKGVSVEQQPVLNDGLKILNQLWQDCLGSEDFSDKPHGGAAGGLAAGLQVFCGAKLMDGCEFIAKSKGLEDLVSSADIVITGEGKLDKSTLQGKLPLFISRLCKKWNKKCIAIAGTVVYSELQLLYDQGLTAAFSICSGPMSLQHAIHHTPELLHDLIDQIIRLI